MKSLTRVKSFVCTILILPWFWSRLTTAAIGQSATSITITASGVWASSAQTTFMSAPEAPWQLSLDIPIPLYPQVTIEGCLFSIAVINPQYWLAGVQVLPPGEIGLIFTKAANLQGCGGPPFGAEAGISFFGLGDDPFVLQTSTPLYTGTEDQPILVPGTYTLGPESFYWIFPGCTICGGVELIASGTITIPTSGCQVDDIFHSRGLSNPIGLVNWYIGTNGVAGSPGMGQQMIAHFTPSSGTLNAAAATCGFMGFDWQQSIDALPAPNLFVPLVPSEVDMANISSYPNGSLQAGPASLPWNPSPAPSFYDPVPGTYKPPYPAVPDSAPFYYLASDANLPGMCAYQDEVTKLCDSAPYFPITDLTTLSFYDSPGDACLPGDGVTPPNEETILKRIVAGCSDAGIPSGYVAFTTSLVGLLQDQNASGTCSPPAYQNCIASPPLYQWQWKTTYNGTSGGVYPLYNSLSPDPGSGTGGITITSVNGVSQTPPSVSCSATPTTLWPPNGKSVVVTVSGTATAGTQLILASGTKYAVTDSYGEDQPSGPFTLGTGGSYSFEVPLVASRNGNDQNGRTYTIMVTAADAIGNVGLCSAIVTVPHDQGN